eukprot:GHVU01006204.1.p1 GENE.GHVU01006204.1~~GHVU01006204.1.p1  ORF type:complete len:139 (+),score=3.74 GHVU01006204.1:1003-1419(+)
MPHQPLALSHAAAVLQPRVRQHDDAVVGVAQRAYLFICLHRTYLSHPVRHLCPCVTRVDVRHPPVKYATTMHIIMMAAVEAVDLLSKMLVYNPAKRISASDVFLHAFFEEFEYPKQTESAALCAESFELTDASEATLR